MIFLARRRRISPPPPLVERTPWPPAPFTAKHARTEQSADPLTGPIEITDTAVLYRQLTESPVREAVWLTSRASNFRFPLRCIQCHGEHVNLNADTFHDLHLSARNAGWREDQFRTWRCPRCARRYEAALGVPPVAAIERGAAS